MEIMRTLAYIVVVGRFVKIFWLHCNRFCLLMLSLWLCCYIFLILCLASFLNSFWIYLCSRLHNFVVPFMQCVSCMWTQLTYCECGDLINGDITCTSFVVTSTRIQILPWIQNSLDFIARGFLLWLKFWLLLFYILELSSNNNTNS